MKGENATDNQKWIIEPKNAFLAALHVLILFISLVVHPPIKIGAAWALP